MTRDEAIHIVDVTFDVPQAVRRIGEDRTYHEDEIREAKDMAIQALQEPSGDAVSRLWLMRKATEMFYTTNYFNHITKMIEEAPSVKPQEPSGDLISRQAVYRCFDGNLKNDNITVQEVEDYLKTVTDRIERLPTVAIPQEPKWIPVSEKLPKPFTFVNATCRSLVDDRENWVVETVYVPIPKEVNKHGYSDWGNIPMLNWGEAEVVAWVERIIPQPYKAEVEPQEGANE